MNEISKELLKIAREINKLASDQNIANEEGMYKNFTGTIDWGETQGQVRNATFRLNDYAKDKSVSFENGVWQNGTMHYGVFKNGTWKNGTAKGVDFWHHAIWEKGIFDIAKDRYGNVSGMFRGGTWKNGTWKNGIWQSGIWKNGTWQNGTWYPSVDAIWEKGKWIKGNIFDIGYSQFPPNSEEIAEMQYDRRMERFNQKDKQYEKILFDNRIQQQGW